MRLRTLSLPLEKLKTEPIFLTSYWKASVLVLLRALSWMLAKAQQAGLNVAPFDVAEDAWNTAPKDSFADFLKGFYARYKRLGKKTDGRLYQLYSEGMPGHRAVNISVDTSVWQR